MLKNTTKIVAIFLVLVLLFSTTFVFADNENNEISTNETATEETQNNSENQISNSNKQENTYKKSDVYLTEDEVTVDYIIDGNLFVCANTVTINSQIGGDAFIMAKKIIVEKEAYIFSNLFAMAESIEIKGVVYDLYALTKDLNISGGYVYRDVKTACQNLTINGTIGRNVYAGCGNINFNTEEGAKGVVYGNLEYSSKKEISIPENTVNGTVKFNQDNESEEVNIRSEIADGILSLITFIIFVLVIGIVCSKTSNNFLCNPDNYAGSKALKLFGLGLLTAIIVPILSIILLILNVTSSISLLLIVMYILAFVVAKALFTVAANYYICKKSNITKGSTLLIRLALTALVVWLVGLIPFVGDLATFIIIILGLGLFVKTVLPCKKDK